MKVNFYATFRIAVGAKTVTLPLPEGSTVSQLLRAVVEQYPALQGKLADLDGKLTSHAHIFINGRDAALLPGALETPLSGEDKVDIFPPVAGG